MACSDNCNPYKILIRLVRFGISLWMIADIAMDAVTTKKFYDSAQVTTHSIRLKLVSSNIFFSVDTQFEHLEHFNIKP